MKQLQILKKLGSIVFMMSASVRLNRFISHLQRGVTLPTPYFRQKLCEVYEKSAQELGLVSKKIESAPATDVPLSPLPIALTQEDHASVLECAV